MKVLIVSLWGNRNYGNKLQNYALVKLINDLGFSTVVAKHNEPKSIREWYRMIRDFIIKDQTFVLFKNLRRFMCFNDFNRLYVKNSINVNDFEVKKSQIRDVDYAITGSDQVWHNWFGMESELDYYYLSFVTPQKRVAYAASFGFDRIEERDIEIHRRGLSELGAISVREKTAADIVEGLIGRRPQILPDPTLCIRPDEWRNIEKKPSHMPKNEYLLVSFIGRIPDSANQDIMRISKEKKLDVIRINDINCEYYSVGPSEFLWLIDNASMVCTDSFHTTVFSIVFKKQFYSYNRVDQGFENMFDRIRTLLEMTQLTDREVGTGGLSDISLISDNQFQIATELINNKAVEAKEYLKKTIV